MKIRTYTLLDNLKCVHYITVFISKQKIFRNTKMYFNEGIDKYRYFNVLNLYFPIMFF